MAIAEGAIALDGKFAAAYNNRGVVHFEAGDKTAACADRSKACELGYAPSCKWTKANCQAVSSRNSIDDGRRC